MTIWKISLADSCLYLQLTLTRKMSTTTVQTKFDAKILHDNPMMAAETGMVDDGKSAKEVYRVNNFDLVQVPEEEYGKFYSGDCYVILYAYNDGRKDCYIIYYWLVSYVENQRYDTVASASTTYVFGTNQSFEGIKCTILLNEPCRMQLNQFESGNP